MNLYLKTILSNTLKYEADYILQNEEDLNSKISRLNEVFNMKKIIDHYDELEPVLKKFFADKSTDWEENR